jgi:hypothetical protein
MTPKHIKRSGICPVKWGVLMLALILLASCAAGSLL